jgi:alpha-glucosidase
MTDVTALKWWQKAVFYQIYPRSFADGNSDGIGDFLGMIDRLDYLQSLGIDAIWLSPHYPSPMADCGYDVFDYLNVAPEYGTLEDFIEFLEGAHRRGIRLIIDLVLNHTSDQHAWFLESRSSRDNPKRNWYLWRDGKDGAPPNNWESTFGGPAWEYDPGTDQYYYHYFFKEQPDLNWRNPEVKEAMWEVVRFWLDLGVDGFRLDALGTIFEDPGMPDHKADRSLNQLRYAFIANYPDTPTGSELEVLAEQWRKLFEYQVEQPGMHGLMRELRTIVDQYPDRVLVGENEHISYYGNGSDELHLAFNFPLMRTDQLTPAWIRSNQEERLNALPPGAWPCNTLGNHDSPRVYNRFGDGLNDASLARLSLALMLTLRGTPFLYYGEEIGMTDLNLDDIHQFRDNLGVWAYRTMVEDFGMEEDKALALANRGSRDKCRTPMQWAYAPNAGFSPELVHTWLPVNPNFVHEVNVTEQNENPGSLLNFYRRMLAMRKRNPALIQGDYTPILGDDEDTLVFLRRSVSNDQTCLVVLNLSDRSQTLQFDLDFNNAKLIFSSHERKESQSDQFKLNALEVAPFEIFICEAVESP